MLVNLSTEQGEAQGGLAEGEDGVCSSQRHINNTPLNPPSRGDFESACVIFT